MRNRRRRRFSCAGDRDEERVTARFGSVRFCVPGTESERRTRYGGLRTDKLYGRPASWLFFQTGASEIARPDCPKDTGRIDPSHLTITTGRGPTSWPRTKRWPAASRAMSDVRQCRSPLCAGPQSGHRPYKSCRAGTRRDEAWSAASWANVGCTPVCAGLQLW